MENHDEAELLRQQLEEKEQELQKQKAEIAKLKSDLLNSKPPITTSSPITDSAAATVPTSLEIWGRRRRLLLPARFTSATDRLNLAPRFGTSSMCPRPFEILDQDVGDLHLPNVRVHSSDGKFDTGNWWIARASDHGLQQKMVTIAVYCGGVGSVGSYGATVPYPSHHMAEVTSDFQLFVAHVRGLGIHLVFTF